ncbi:MAG: hypothetical protein RRA32_08955 [bacterium]|nr:hypothetical protein [bacterium]
MKRLLFSSAAAVIVILALSACAYRFADPFPARNYDLVSVTNSTAEPGLSRVLEEELRLTGGFTPGSGSRLYVTATRFTEQVETVSSAGTPVRQRLALEIAWKVEGEGHRSEAVFGNEGVREIYPYSADPASLDWNRKATVKLLAKKAADRVIRRLEGAP